MAFRPVPNLGDKFTSDPFCNNLPRTGLFFSFVRAWRYELLQLGLCCETAPQELVLYVGLQSTRLKGVRCYVQFGRRISSLCFKGGDIFLNILPPTYSTERSAATQSLSLQKVLASADPAFVRASSYSFMPERLTVTAKSVLTLIICVDLHCFFITK